MSKRHVATKHVGGNHTRKVDRIFGASELRRVAQLGFFEIVDGRVASGWPWPVR